MTVAAPPPPRSASPPGAIQPPPAPFGAAPNGHGATGVAYPVTVGRDIELSDLIREPIEGLDPQLLLVIGPPGTGKTSLGAGGPSPLFVMADRGGARSLSKKLYRHRSYPNAWDRVLGEPATIKIIGEDGEEREESRVYVVDILNTLLVKKHDRRTVVFDTVNRLRDLLHAWICAKNGKAASIDVVGRGYGEGVAMAAVEWNKMLSVCWDLRDHRRMNVVLTCHQESKKVPNPAGEDAEMWVPALDKKAIEIWNGGVDTILYLQPTTRIKSENVGSNNKPRMRHKVEDFDGVTAYTRPAPGMWAKNRDMLSEEIDGISWAILEEEAEKGQAIQGELQEVLARAPRTTRAAAERLLGASNWTQEKALDIISKAKKAEKT